ncbi:EDD domain protein, DegV family [Acholeplasma oculi]|uniref:DAK1/DegV-like superfamily protein n=1 Tax=Acholeplasma oculi TaxID=35623 RepID=A0A061AA24_9MOLU|nr:DegV family protein [Acholeplasma oculi]CDR30750.1 DAK1/DegV-like superfamily protein [Acholeplasma oculi]SKC34843.1 EDD domain protein, DegV family [Acholeplasma oculi]SUT89647.1 EDD domain protein, DegV family [Acholeplasma oculi]
MNKVIITTDSTADLSQDILNNRGIQTIPLYVRFGDETYKDGVEIQTELLYEKVSELGYLPKTQAASPGDFEVFFKKYLNLGYDIVHISIGSKISATYQSAVIAKDLLESENIYIVDSKNLSSGIGLLVLKASDLKEQGQSASEIYNSINKLVPKISSQFAIKTLDYLHKGGRASGLTAFVGSVLQIKPIIKVIDGKLEVYKKSVGKMKRALDLMIDDLVKVKEKIDKNYVFITHSIADDSFNYIKEQLTDKIEVKQIIEGHAGCVISSHCGKGTIGILYIEIGD